MKKRTGWTVWRNSVSRYSYILRKAAASDAAALAQPVAEEAGDTIYGLDRHVEPVIERVINSWPERCKPLILIAEGMGKDGVQSFGSEDRDANYRVIIDPIDGTRGLMYDKRSAWFLAAVGPNLGPGTSLSDTFAAVMVELPTTKQSLADYFLAGAAFGNPWISCANWRRKRRAVDGSAEHVYHNQGRLCPGFELLSRNQNTRR